MKTNKKTIGIDENKEKFRKQIGNHFKTVYKTDTFLTKLGSKEEPQLGSSKNNYYRL